VLRAAPNDVGRTNQNSFGLCDVWRPLRRMTPQLSAGRSPESRGAAKISTNHITNLRLTRMIPLMFAQTRGRFHSRHHRTQYESIFSLRLQESIVCCSGRCACTIHLDFSVQLRGRPPPAVAAQPCTGYTRQYLYKGI
jgi:hypothetical protein